MWDIWISLRRRNRQGKTSAMAKLNKKRCAVIAGAMLIAAVLAADYAGVFAVVHGDGGASTGFLFKCVDKVTGSPVAGVQLGCFFEGKQIPRARRPKGAPAPASVGGFITYMRVGAEGSTKDGRIKGMLIYGYASTETLFFTLYDSAAESRKKSVEFVFSHPSYQKETRAYVVGHLRKDIVIELAPAKR